MTVLQQLLLLPLLAPLLAMLLLAGVNPKPTVALRLLVWTTPALPLGTWMAAAAAAGAGLSGCGTALALRQSRQRPWSAAAGPGPEPAQARTAASSPRRGPSRRPGEPSPTVEVPFRVIRKARPAPQASASPNPPPASPGPFGGSAKAVGDGWDQQLSSDWD